MSAAPSRAPSTGHPTQLDGLLSKTVQAASLLIRPAGDAVEMIKVFNDLPSQAVPGGVLLELGDYSSGEQRKLLFGIGVPALTGLGLAHVADFVLEFVTIPELESRKVTVPVSVTAVPLDVAIDGYTIHLHTQVRTMVSALEEAFEIVWFTLWNHRAARASVPRVAGRGRPPDGVVGPWLAGD